MTGHRDVQQDRLEPSAFAHVVRHAPLISVDLILRNDRGEVLLGLRNNAPARDFWFVPGGRVRKAERLAAAFRRITRDETGHAMAMDEARFLGVFEHHYGDNFTGTAEFGTHYVVLAYQLQVGDMTPTADAQHRSYRWWGIGDLIEADSVHDHTKAYFRE